MKDAVFLVSLYLMILVYPVARAAETPAGKLPKVFALDPQILTVAKQRVLAGDPLLKPALDRLRRDADKSLRVKSGSVMDKTKTPPSGDKHDYMSLAPYSWPNPSKPDGLPYINRDGEVNPETKTISDHTEMSKTISAVDTLALAYYFTGHEPYAEKAAALIKGWFLDPATKMNPNLNYAQAVLGRSDGRGTGIIDVVGLIHLVDSIGLLDGSKAWTPELQHGMEGWFRAFNQWMLTSKNGLDEAKSANNHGSWYLAQTAAYALFTGDQATARKQVEAGKKNIAAQIELDGRQPLELKRTKSYMYSLYNLDALFILAELGRRVNVDLFQYRSQDGRSLQAALDFVAQYFPDPKGWPAKQIEPIKQPDTKLAGLLRRASIAFTNPKYEQLIAKADVKDIDPCLWQLLWPVPK